MFEQEPNRKYCSKGCLLFFYSPSQPGLGQNAPSIAIKSSAGPGVNIFLFSLPY
jgi:hypothetical protein